MTPAIPVIDLDAADAGDRSQLDAVRAATEVLGVVQVVNHGVPPDLAEDLNARMARLLSLPRAEKAKLASPHPYRGWRQWPDDFGRLELERFNVAQFDDIGRARAAGVAEEHLGLYAHDNVWPQDEPGLRAAAFGYMEASRRLAGRMLRLYASVHGLPGDAFGLGALPHLRLTVNDYPTWRYQEPAADEDKLLLLEHADDSAVTVLAQQGDYEGLQVQAAGGDWIPVPLIPGALQVFSGSLLARWTGGRLRRPAPGGRGRHGDTPVGRGLRLPGAGDGGGDRSRRSRESPGAPPVLVWDHVKDRVADYLRRVRPPRPDRRLARGPALCRRAGGELRGSLGGDPALGELTGNWAGPIPASRASATASARETTCSLVRTAETWLRTVLSDTTRRRAMVTLSQPRARRSRISRSRAVSWGNGSGPRPWAAAAKNPTTRSAIFGPNTASPRATARTARVMSSELDSLSR